MWNLSSFCLETVLVLVKDTCIVCARHRLKNHFGQHLMVPLGDVAQVEAHFSPFGDSVNLDAREVHGLRQTHHRLRNQFGGT